MISQFARDVTRVGPGIFERVRSGGNFRGFGQKLNLENACFRFVYPATVVALPAYRQGVEAGSLHLGKGNKETMKMTKLKTAAASVAAGTLFAMISLVPGAAQTEIKFTDAASYYKDGKCVVCHGQKGEKKFDATLANEALADIVLKGKKAEKPPNMPAYEAKGITGDQATALVVYMKSLKQ
jgi:mono/diheme cytochrome c family protein